MANGVKVGLLKIYRKMVSILLKTNIQKFSFTKKLHKLIVPNLVPKSVKIEGHTIFIDPTDYLYLSTKKYEPFEKDIIEQIVKEGDIVVDIGANLGYFTLILARKVGNKGRVFAFEPDPDMFKLLKKNVKINGYKNVTLIKKATFNKSGKLKLLIYADKGDSGVICGKNTKSTATAVTIDAVKLDDYFKKYPKKIDFIKMDIEGSEGMAFAGMENIFKNNDNVKMITEFFPKWLENHPINADKYYKLLQKQNLSIYSIDEDRKRVTAVNKRSQIINDRRTDYYYSNLLCLKGSDKQQFIEHLKAKLTKSK